MIGFKGWTGLDQVALLEQIPLAGTVAEPFEVVSVEAGLNERLEVALLAQAGLEYCFVYITNTDDTNNFIAICNRDTPNVLKTHQ